MIRIDRVAIITGFLAANPTITTKWSLRQPVLTP
jgi:hypothetical protein